MKYNSTDNRPNRKLLRQTDGNHEIDSVFVKEQIKTTLLKRLI